MRQQLIDAAIRTDMRQTNRIIETIHQYDPILSGYLLTLAANFEYDTILSYLNKIDMTLKDGADDG